MDKIIELESSDKYTKFYMDVSQKTLQFVLNIMNEKCYVVSDSMMRIRAKLIKENDAEPSRTICLCSLEGADGIFTKVNKVGFLSDVDDDYTTLELFYIVESNTFIIKWAFAYSNEFNYINIHKIMNK